MLCSFIRSESSEFIYDLQIWRAWVVIRAKRSENVPKHLKQVNILRTLPI